MVKVELHELPEEEVDGDVFNYLSDDSDEGDEDLLRKKFAEIEPLVTLDETFPNTIIIVGVPKVGSDKYEKLIKVLQKKIKEELQRKGAEVVEGTFDIEMPMGEDDQTQGFCFLTFQSAFETQHAVKHLNNFALDARHKFKAALADEFDDVVKRDDSYRPPIKLLGFTREKFRWWLYDKRCREQFVVRYQDETEIFWHDPVDREPVMVYNGERERAEGKRVWTDFRVQWSPWGSYLATFHKPGIALWAGASFEKKVRFEHKDVKQIEFSPNEEYLITWDGSPAAMKNERACRVWRVVTGEILRTFSTPSVSPRGGEFPHFLWSPDDKFVAKCSDRELFIYDLPSMTLTEDATNKKTTLKYSLEKFEWSPGESIVSIWIAEKGDAPGRLLLVDIPSRKEMSSKNVYNVRDASLHWQSRGDFLCLRAIVARRTGKKGRKEYTQLEIFRMRDKNIPVDTVHVEDVTVKQLHWEDASKRFAIIVQDEGSHSQSVRFYRVSDAGARRDTVLVTSYDMGSYMNFMKWAPGGTHFILAGLGSDGTLMFCSLNENDKFDILHKDEHFMVNEIKWSSCGRFVVTSVSIPMIASGSSSATWRHSMEAGYNIWTFQGRLQYKCQKDKFYQFHWRPHPPSLIDAKQFEDIQKRLKEVSKKYDAIDEQLRTAQRDTFQKQRKSEMDEFWKICAELQAWKQKHPLYREWEEALSNWDAQFDWEDKEEKIEEELDVKEENLG